MHARFIRGAVPHLVPCGGIHAAGITISMRFVTESDAIYAVCVHLTKHSRQIWRRKAPRPLLPCPHVLLAPTRREESLACPGGVGLLAVLSEYSRYKQGVHLWYPPYRRWYQARPISSIGNFGIVIDVGVH